MLSAIIAPLVVPWIAMNLGLAGRLPDRWAVGLFGWQLLGLRTPPAAPARSRLGAAGAHVVGPAASRARTWEDSLACRALHARRGPSLIGKFLTDPIWWFYLYWLPAFSTTTASRCRRPTPGAAADRCLLVAADVGSIGGGWITSACWPEGCSVNRSRRMRHAAVRGGRDRRRLVRFPEEICD